MPADSDGNIMLSDVDYLDTWREMEKCVQLGLTRSIGLSNFNSQQIDRVLANATIKPVNLQVRVAPVQKSSDFGCYSKGNDFFLTLIHRRIYSIDLSLSYLQLVFSILL
jgi:aldehyde reductase